MKLTKYILLIVAISHLACSAQNQKNMETNQNPLLCDPKDGICEIPSQANPSKIEVQKLSKPLKVIYFTDPICSSCWGIEPQLRKLKLEYGQDVEIEYRMGGLLPDWSYNSGGISKPSDVAHHWDEVSVYYEMPIDGDVWLEDPLNSSYPPSIAFKAAQIQNHEKALLFLREIREMVFLQKKNITKWENLALAAQNVGLNAEKLKSDMDTSAKTNFEEDLKMAKQFGVRGFPTLFFVDSVGQKETVYGSKPYSFYENAILKLHPEATKIKFARDWKTLFTSYQSFTLKEFSVLTETPKTESETVLNELVTKGFLEKFNTKNGSIWRKRL